jgi:hypothetical protein
VRDRLYGERGGAGLEIHAARRDREGGIDLLQREVGPSRCLEGLCRGLVEPLCLRGQ